MEFPKTFGGFLKNYLNRLVETPMHFSYPLGPFLWLQEFKKNSKKNSSKAKFWENSGALLMQFWSTFEKCIKSASK